APYFACMSLSSGISLRQGGHQVAQKFTSNALPSHSVTVREVPLRSGRVNTGRVSGTCSCGAGSGVRVRGFSQRYRPKPPAPATSATTRILMNREVERDTISCYQRFQTDG